MSIIETAYDSLKRALSAADFEDAQIVAGDGAAIATVRYAHLAGMSLRWVGIGLWLLGCGEPCRTADESFFREIRKVEFDVITTAEVEPIVHGSANEIVAELKAFRRALLRLLASAGIDTQHARPFEPNDKAKVERAIKTVQHDLMTLLAGYAGHSVAERKTIEGRKAFSRRLGETEGKLLEVKLTAAELQSACDRWVTTAHDNQLHSTLGTTPLMKWGEYTGKIRRIADERALDVLLMPIAGRTPVRKVQNRGIPVENGWFVPPPGVLPGAQVFCRQHPTDFGKLLVFTPDQATYLGEAECPERTGTSRAAITAHRQAVQNRIVKEGRADLRRKQREYARPEVVFESYLKGAAAEAPNVTPLLNRPSTPVSTPALDAAAAATQPRRHDRTVTLDAKVGARMDPAHSAPHGGIERPARGHRPVTRCIMTRAPPAHGVAVHDGQPLASTPGTPPVLVLVTPPSDSRVQSPFSRQRAPSSRARSARTSPPACRKAVRSLTFSSNDPPVVGRARSLA